MPDIFDAGTVAKTTEAVRIRDKHAVDELPQPLDAREAPQNIDQVTTTRSPSHNFANRAASCC